MRLSVTWRQSWVNKEEFCLQRRINQRQDLLLTKSVSSIKQMWSSRGMAGWLTQKLMGSWCWSYCKTTDQARSVCIPRRLFCQMQSNKRTERIRHVFGIRVTMMEELNMWPCFSTRTGIERAQSLTLYLLSAHLRRVGLILTTSWRFMKGKINK